MPQIDHYNQNAYISFPFKTITQMRRLGTLAWADDVILDAGFIIDSKFAPVTLYRAMVQKPDIVFMFLCDGRIMSIKVPIDAPAGTVTRAGGGTWDGFIVTGEGLNKLSWYADGGHTFYPALELEYSCSQWLHDAWVTGFDLANRTTGDAVMQAAGLTGDVAFQPGYNAAVAVREGTNTLEILDDLGGGAGIPCWPHVDEELPCAGFITTINGAGPDGSGDFSITGGNGIEVHNYPNEHKIVIDFTQALIDFTCEV